MTEPVHTTRRNIGRPSAYTDDIPERMIDFFDKDFNDYIQHNFTTAGKSNYRVLPIPTLTGFCREIGVTNQSFHRWMSADSSLTEDQRAILSDAYTQAKRLQEQIVTQIGMATNGTFAAFMLKCNFGWRDNTEVKTDEDVKPIRVKIVSERPVELDIQEGGQAAVDWGDD